jgi:hypothetical protein
MDPATHMMNSQVPTFMSFNINSSESDSGIIKSTVDSTDTGVFGNPDDMPT